MKIVLTIICTYHQLQKNELRSGNNQLPPSEHTVNNV